MVKKECINCDKYIPYCKLYGYFDKGRRPRVDKVCGCENEGSRCCKKGDRDGIFGLSGYATN